MNNLLNNGVTQHLIANMSGVLLLLHRTAESIKPLYRINIQHFAVTKDDILECQYIWKDDIYKSSFKSIVPVPTMSSFQMYYHSKMSSLAKC